MYSMILLLAALCVRPTSPTADGNSQIMCLRPIGYFFFFFFSKFIGTIFMLLLSACYPTNPPLPIQQTQIRVLCTTAVYQQRESWSHQPPTPLTPRQSSDEERDGDHHHRQHSTAVRADQRAIYTAVVVASRDTTRQAAATLVSRRNNMMRRRFVSTATAAVATAAAVLLPLRARAASAGMSHSCTVIEDGMAVKVCVCT